jgi:hypothetical protein
MMFEAAIALALLCYLLLLALPGVELQIMAGTLVTLVGLAGGGGAGIVYHLALRAALLRLGADTRGWLWSPVAHHRALDELGKRQVLPWFRLGAAGFFVCVAGIGMVTVAILRTVFS